MKKLILVVSVLFAFIFVFTGCGDDREKVVIYTSAEDYRVEYMQQRMEEQFPQYNIIFEYKSSGNHAAALLAAGSSVECDITHDLEYSYAEKIASMGILADISDIIDFSVYSTDIVQSEFYAPELRNGGAIIVNIDILNSLGLDTPTSYQDLLDPQYQGLISMPNPASSGTGYMFLLALVNAWGEETAFEYFNELSNNILSFTSSGSGPVNALTTGEVAIGLGMTANAVTKIGEGVNLQVLFFDEGSPFSLYGQGIISGKEDRESVKEVFEFLATTLTEEMCERFYPEKIYENIDYTIKNYPSNIKYADMSGNTPEKKEDLLSKWEY